VAAAADALGIARLAAAAVMPAALAGAVDGSASRWLPAGLFAFAAASDFLDGRIARAVGRPTRYGAVLDNVADIAFVLAATGAGAAAHLVPWAVPAAIALAFAGYAAASARGRARGGAWDLARSRVGHAGGVLNYALAGLVAGAVALPGAAWASVLGVASALVIAVNLAAVLGRLLPRRAT
jgi:phosphatidylglycerophosphate synthase